MNIYFFKNKSIFKVYSCKLIKKRKSNLESNTGGKKIKKLFKIEELFY